MLMKLMIAPIGIIVCMGVAGASVYLNLLYGLSVMSGSAAIAIAATFVGLDILKVFVLSVIGWEAMAGRIKRTSFAAMAGYLYWAVACCLSAFCAAQLYIGSLDTNVAERLSIKSQHQTLNMQRAEQLEALGVVRGSLVREEMVAQLKGMEQSALFGPARTKGCTDATLPDSRIFCEKWELVKGKVKKSVPVLERSGKITEIRNNIKAIDAKLDALNLVAVHDSERKGSNAMDPRVNTALGFAIALLIELAATTILSLFVSVYATRKPEPKPEPHRIKPAQVVDQYISATVTDAPEVDGPVMRWADLHLVTARGQRVPATELYNAYKLWARHGGERSITQAAFGIEMKRLGFKKQKKGKFFYLNVRVLASQPERPKLELVVNS